jgi:AcrR family transcriptional regulator
MSTRAAPSSESPAPRCLRADAQRNYDMLVAAADAEFTERGADVALEDIAKRANVGIGTLYRHFPTRDDLLAKVLGDSTRAILNRGHELLAGSAPADDLFTWISEVAAYTAAYRGLTAAVANSYTRDGTSLCQSCDAMAACGSALLARAQAAGEVRQDAQVVEIMLTAHSAAWIGEQTKDPHAVNRLLAILFDGLRVRPPAKPAPRTKKSPARR